MTEALPSGLHAELLGVAERWLKEAEGMEPHAAFAIRECASELSVRLEAHPPEPSVSLAELAQAFCRHEVGALLTKYQPPQNPHPRGTYLWASEEHLRGRLVGRAGREVHRSADWIGLRFTHEEIVATDWEVVK